MTDDFEPWLDKKALAAHLSCSTRSIQKGLAQGMPHAIVFGRVKFKVSQVEPWLEQHGHLVHHSREDGGSVNPHRKCPGGAVNAPGPDTRS